MQLVDLAILIGMTGSGIMLIKQTHVGCGMVEKIKEVMVTLVLEGTEENLI